MNILRTCGRLLFLCLFFSVFSCTEESNYIQENTPASPSEPDPDPDTPTHTHVALSPKIDTQYGNPLLDFAFSADPTSIEHEGRLYVYATNDHQQYETSGAAGTNNYAAIRSLQMMSTDDMVNWTYHGTIPVKTIAPWITNSWAPSVVKREEADGQTHFYLYFSNSGGGVGVLTSTSPTGPWTDPLGRDLVNGQTPGLGVCAWPFDPGALIDDSGIGWLTLGGGDSENALQPGNARIVRLASDMISFDSEFIPIDAPYHFEANELNYINGTWVYTYCTSWDERTEWPYGTEAPTACCMSYMTSKTPLARDSWEYGHSYLKNPGEYGFDWGNNHTHLQKFMDKWYIFYHNQSLQRNFNSTGGYRSVCVDEIEVDETMVDISMGEMTKEGPSQTKPLDPFAVQQAETVAATQCVQFEQDDDSDNMLVKVAEDQGMIQVRGVRFDREATEFAAYASGKGTLEVRQNTSGGKIIATIEVDSGSIMPYTVQASLPANSTVTLCFILKGKSLRFDQWTFR